MVSGSVAVEVGAAIEGVYAIRTVYNTKINKKKVLDMLLLLL